MDESFGALVVALRILATASGFDEHDRLRGAELAIKRYIERYQDTERQSEPDRNELHVSQVSGCLQRVAIH